MLCCPHMPSPVLPDPLPEDTHTVAPGSEQTRSAPFLLQRSSPVNWFLIAGSVLLYLWSEQGENLERLLPWFISISDARVAPLLEVRHGEVWRLFTPAFIHFGIAHLGFNMLNLVGLGNVLERRLRSWHYLLLVVSLAVFSNLTQYFVTGNWAFGGMSGVIYGLIGYIWLRGRFDLTFGLGIPQQMIVIALVWFVACVVGFIPHVANSAHGAGLVLGAIWGVLDGRRAMERVRRR